MATKQPNCNDLADHLEEVAALLRQGHVTHRHARNMIATVANAQAFVARYPVGGRFVTSWGRVGTVEGLLVSGASASARVRFAHDGPAARSEVTVDLTVEVPELQLVERDEYGERLA